MNSSDLSKALLAEAAPKQEGNKHVAFARSAALVIGLIVLVTAAVSLVILVLIPDLAALGLLAYCFGCRHGIDADHIAAIDNVTRRLVAAGKRAMTVGIFFSLGHCSVVLMLCVFVMTGASASGAQIEQVAQIGSVAGPWVGAAVLGTIGIINVFSARDLHAQYQQRTSRGHEHEIASLVGRCCPSWIAGIQHPSQVFWIGLLFGLGLDTASEIALLTLSALAEPTVPRLSVMLLPMLFAAGMALVDSLNGLLMLWAYEWTSDNGPMQRLFFSLFLTIASAVVALCIAALQALGATVEQFPSLRAGCDDGREPGTHVASASGKALGVSCAFWDGMIWANEHLETLGLFIVCAFLTAITSAVVLAPRCVPSQSEIERQEAEKGRASLNDYLRGGQFIVRFE